MSSAARTRRPLPKTDETSAGGLVVDSVAHPVSGALIGRAVRAGPLTWSLPKGHIEAGETREFAAIREVREETGIVGRVVAPLGTIDYWFVAERRRIHKTVHHFLLVAEGGQLSDADVEVTEVAWVPIQSIPGMLAYRDERGLIASVPRLLAEVL